MKVLALVPYPLDTAPGQRYRIEQWAPYLGEQGIDVTFAPFATPDLAQRLYAPGHLGWKAMAMLKALARRFREVASAGEFDALWVFREACLVGPAWAERIAWRKIPRLLFDFDDAIYLRYKSPANRYLSYLKFPGKTAALCRMASAVTVGNESLAEYARRYNKSVHVVPSTISLRAYRPRPERLPGATPVIGWMGSHSSAQYLPLISRALQRLRERRPFRFLVVGGGSFALPGVDVETRAWSSNREVEDLWEMDIGVMPLRDDPWSRGKCGMKALQYMGVGIPAVASPVGVNREIIQEGLNGLLPSTENDWVDALGRLLDDGGLRARLGQAARATVEHGYSAETQVPRLAALLRGVTA
jgi:glycosyltransferase involved in cell wall biosynthesis